MKHYIIYFAIILLISSCLLGKKENPFEHIGLENWETTTPSKFRMKQMQFERVRKAYAEKEILIKKMLTSKEIHSFDYDLFFRVFKKEKELEVWVKNKNEKQYQLLTTYPFCKSSGKLGPKRKEGDRQIPEGFYRINHFNPKSDFLLSLRVNYPNASDKILSHPTAPGSDIYVHGGCQTVGCVPLTNDKIQELYILAVEEQKEGKSIPIHFFPTKNWSEILEEDSSHFIFWQNLKAGFDFFEKNKKVPNVEVLENGVYIFSN